MLTAGTEDLIPTNTSLPAITKPVDTNKSADTWLSKLKERIIFTTLLTSREFSTEPLSNPPLDELCNAQCIVTGLLFESLTES